MKNVTIKELRASEGPEGGSDTSLARRTDRALNHRSISPAQPSPWLGDLVRKMARLETINWQSVNPSLQKAIFDALCDRCKPMADGRERKNKLRSFNLSKLPTPFPSIARARGARHYEHQDWSIEFFHGLESLRLHDVCNADVVKRIGNYLRSPAGNVIKEVKLGCMAPYTSPDSLEVLFTGTKEPNTQTVQLDTLQLSRFYCGYQFGLDSYLDTANLKVLRLINCNAKEALRGPDKTPIKFPNLKTFHIGGKYDLMPDVFDALPVLEELCIPVECRFEREFGGTINNFLVRNGKGLKRLYLDFVRRPRTWLEELTPKDWGRYEIDWMLLVAETCVNLEELGLRGAVTKAKVSHSCCFLSTGFYSDGV